MVLALSQHHVDINQKKKQRKEKKKKKNKKKSIKIKIFSDIKAQEHTKITTQE